MFAEKTDTMRRLSLQLALQLPVEVDEARRVLAMTEQCLDQFLIEQPGSARARAARLGWDRVAIDRGGEGEPRLPPCWAIGWALATLVVALPLGAAAVGEFGIGAGFVFAIDVVIVALVLGTAPALILAGVIPPLDNLLVMPPRLHFSAISMPEIIAAVGYLVLALGVPWLARHRLSLRRKVLKLTPIADASAVEYGPLREVG